MKHQKIYNRCVCFFPDVLKQNLYSTAVVVSLQMKHFSCKFLSRQPNPIIFALSSTATSFIRFSEKIEYLTKS